MISHESFLTGVTAGTPQHLQLDAGVFLKDYTIGEDILAENILGATRGGGTLSVVPTIHHVAADGIPENYVGMDRIDEYVGQISTTMLEVTPESVVLALGGAASAANVKRAGSEIEDVHITLNHTLSASNYHDVWWLGNLSDGRLIAVKFSNAMSKSGLSLNITDKGEGTYGIALTAHYSGELYKQGKAPVDIWFISNKDGANA